MHTRHGSYFASCRLLAALWFCLALVLSCSAPVQRPIGPARDYEDAKDMFKRNNFSRTLELTDGLASASPPTKYTERALVLRSVIYAGESKGFREMVDAYGKGAEQTKNAPFKAAYERQRHDNIQNGSRAVLGLATTTHRFNLAGGVPKELTLEAPYPATEGPLEIKELMRVKEGGWVEPDQQDSAAIDSLNKGVDDALAQAVGGDRSKARAALASGSTKISGVDFALFLGKELVDGASMFDRKHGRDPQKLRTVCGEADEMAKGALALLKDNPNKDKEAAIKKLQDRIKTTLKSV
jgi:hypothetical protein